MLGLFSTISSDTGSLHFLRIKINIIVKLFIINLPMGAKSPTVRAQKLANETNLQISRETNELNRELANQQNQWNIEQWNRQNEYDKPVNQVARMKEAGLSDAAAAQAASNFQSGQVQSADLANQQPASVMPETDGISIIEKIGAVLNGLKDTMSIAQQGQALQHEEMDFFTRTEAQQWAIKQAAQDYMAKRQMHPYNMQALDYFVRSKKYGLVQQEQAITQGYLNIDKAKEDLSFFREVRPDKVRQAAADVAKTLEEIRKVQSDVAKNKSDVALNQAKVSETYANIDNINADTDLKESQKSLVDNQAEGVDLDNVNKRLRNAIAKYGFPDTEAGKMVAFILEEQLSPKDAENFILDLDKFNSLTSKEIFEDRFGTPHIFHDYTKKYLKRMSTGRNTTTLEDNIEEFAPILDYGIKMFR